jgi:hypothetical protein
VTPPSSSYFVRVDEQRFRPTEHTGGAWALDEQHISPLNGLLTHEVERFVGRRPDDGMQIGRIGIEILGVLAIDEFEVAIEVVRPGRTIELLEAVVSAAGRVAARARFWRMATSDTSAIAGGGPDPLPAPESVAGWDLTQVWDGGYIAGLDFRPSFGPEPGRTTAWVATPVPLLPDEPISELARYVGLVDTANGIAVRRSPDEWLFPNLDLTIHLHAQPKGRWTGLDTTVVFGPGGLGVTTTVLHDEHGPVGYAAQSLTLRPRT